MYGHGDSRLYGPQAEGLFLRRSPVQPHGVLHVKKPECPVRRSSVAQLPAFAADAASAEAALRKAERSLGRIKSKNL
jgi:hypothetical protein